MTGPQTAELVKDVMQKNLAAGATCHVLDLRDNAGGYFRAGVDTAALFLPAGKPIVYVVNKVRETAECQLGHA